MRWSRLFVAVGLLATIAGIPTATTLARYTDAATTTASFAADTLDPPTSLAATGGTTVTLTWVQTVDAYASGYAVYRSATSGSGYAQIATVTPATTTTTTDSPGSGTWYYVLATTYQSWSSVKSNEATAAVAVPVTTAYMACTGASNGADTTGAGDNNGYQTNPARACVNDSLYAVDTDSGSGGTQSCGSGATPDAAKDRHRWWGFSLPLPGTVSSIDGIRVQADLKLDAIAGTHNLCAQLSWNNGASWTNLRTVPVTIAAETTYVFGSTSDTWGRSWTAAQLGGANFRIRIIDASSVAARDFSLDYLAVSVTYTP